MKCFGTVSRCAGCLLLRRSSACGCNATCTRLRSHLVANTFTAFTNYGSIVGTSEIFTRVSSCVRKQLPGLASIGCMTGIEPAFVHMDPGPQPGVYTYSTTYTVLLVGFEPTFPDGRRILSPLCIPFHHKSICCRRIGALWAVCVYNLFFVIGSPARIRT